MHRRLIALEDNPEFIEVAPGDVVQESWKLSQRIKLFQVEMGSPPPTEPVLSNQKKYINYYTNLAFHERNIAML